MEWWKKSVVYQIYPKSFKDSNGDGIGDLQGIIEKLDYLEELGVEAIWLSPVYRSPQDDNGYDISDYQDIDPMFGSLEDMDALIQEAKKHNIRIVMDLVLNHSSDEHRWFVEAKKSKENPYHDYYIWRDGEEGKLPNDMKAAFGGSAWEYVPELGQYYFHQFSVKQPDLNWENPKVREEIYQMINWWIDRGVGGFRLDVIDQIGKVPDQKISANGPRLHEFIQEMTKKTWGNKELITVGECWGADVERAKLYSNPDGSEFSMVFQFEHSVLDQKEGQSKWDLHELDFKKLKDVFEKWQTGLYRQGWNSLFWNNHDLPRIVSRWGNDTTYRVESAKMLATVLHGMQGTPYIYEGEELGMTNVQFPLKEYRDIELLNAYKERIEAGYSEEDVMKSIYAKGRDNARTPMQWDASANAGFTEAEVTPWIQVNPNYPEINAKIQRQDPNSVFSYYKKLVALRKEQEILTDGRFELLYKEDPDLFVYTRENSEGILTVAANFHNIEREFPVEQYRKNQEVWVHNYDSFEGNILRPYEAFMFYEGKKQLQVSV